MTECVIVCSQCKEVKTGDLVGHTSNAISEYVINLISDHVEQTGHDCYELVTPSQKYCARFDLSNITHPLIFLR